jgi:hypothetical protein
MTYTGIMLFLSPHGRVAYWSDWHFLGLSKNQYGELHTTSMLIMLLFGFLHIYYNWKPIISYMKDKTKKISFTKKEFLIALGINILFIIGTLTFIQPFKAFLNFEENFKDSWTKQYGEPPYGHAEQTKLNLFCKKINIDLKYAKKELTKNKIIFKDNETILTIAKNNNLSPSDIYNIIKNKTQNNQKDVPNKLGRKTLEELDKMGKIDLNKSLKILKAKGLDDVSKDSRIKDIADELDTTPYEIYEMISH